METRLSLWNKATYIPEFEAHILSPQRLKYALRFGLDRPLKH
jgi:hypothetical protein